MDVLAIRRSSLEECLFSSFGHFKIGFLAFVVVVVELLEFLNIFWILNPYQICQCFLPFSRLPFHSLGSVCFVLNNIFINEREREVDCLPCVP